LRRRRDERGYVAVMTAILSVLLFGVGALAVDVGQWYVVARDTQRAADAGALGGVPYLPTNPTKAFSTARDLVTVNGYTNGTDGAVVSTGLDDGPTQLKVTVSKRVPSILGGIFGVSAATITRSAVADFAGPVPLGSPCNRYGNDPEPGTTGSSLCDEVGQYWGNVGSPKATKISGDAYQDNACGSGVDQCVSGVNKDYKTNGFFYSVTVTKDVQNLVIEAFDPALIHVGDLCDKGTLTGASGLSPTVTDVTDPATRYAKGQSSAFCTGDINFAGDSGEYANMVATNFTIRDPGPNPWDPTSFPVHTTCEGTGTYPGYAGTLSKVLNRNDAKYSVLPSGTGLAPAAQSTGYVARVFRRWVPLCTIANAKAGTYLIQVKTNGVGSDLGNGHNRFSLRAHSVSDSSAKDAIAISGVSYMTMYANLPDANTSFYLARVPSGAAGQILNIKLFDVGDSKNAGNIKVVAPPKSGVTFTNCAASGAYTGNLSTCELTGVDSKYNGKWETIAVTIPAGYQCNDLDTTDCWVRLQYTYGSGNQPSDTTSWEASIDGDPVRLIE
jgi:hypothetical protein